MELVVSKRSVSTLISVVILVLIASILVGIVLTWSQAETTSFLTKATDERRYSVGAVGCVDADFAISDVSINSYTKEIKVLVENKSKISFVRPTITVFGVDEGEDVRFYGYFDETIDSGYLKMLSTTDESFVTIDGNFLEVPLDINYVTISSYNCPREVISLKNIDVDFTEGLVGWWKFDEGEAGTCSGGGDVCDHSGHDNHAVNSGGVWACVEDDENYTQNNTGCSMYLGTINNYITINNPLFQPNLEQEWTVTAWVDITDISSTQYLMSGINHGLRLVYGSTDKLLLYLNSGVNDYYIYSNYTNLLTDQGWKFVVFMFRNEDAYRKIYVDMIDRSGSGPNKTYTPSGLSSTWQIGNSTNGYINNVRIYNRLLNLEEIQKIYNLEKGDE